MGARVLLGAAAFVVLWCGDARAAGLLKPLDGRSTAVQRKIE